MGCSLNCDRGPSFVNQIKLEKESTILLVSARNEDEKPIVENILIQSPRSTETQATPLVLKPQELIEEDNHNQLLELYNQQKQFIYVVPNSYNPYSSFGFRQISWTQSYKGQLSNGCRQGYGLEILFNESIFEGYWDEDDWAEGLLVKSDGEIQRGTFKGKKLEGFGELTRLGYYYKGNFINGLPDGKGEEESTYNGIYTGQFRNGIRQGNGICKYQDDRIYDGEWRDGKYEGQGSMIQNEGKKYSGSWTDGKIEGFGTMVWDDGKKYSGLWKDAQPHGNGLMEWPNGQKYEGDFVNGVKEGKGIYWWPDGVRYEGFFKAGVQHGVGDIVKKRSRKSFLFKGGKRIFKASQDYYQS